MYNYTGKLFIREAYYILSTKERYFEEHKGRTEKNGLKIERSFMRQYGSAEHPSKELTMPAREHEQGLFTSTFLPQSADFKD
jgi:hypothetical protein